MLENLILFFRFRSISAYFCGKFNQGYSFFISTKDQGSGLYFEEIFFQSI